MHTVNIEAVQRAAGLAQADPSSVRQPVELSGEWRVAEGAPQFRPTIPYPNGEVELSCDFPPPLGGSGAAPNPLALGVSERPPVERIDLELDVDADASAELLADLRSRADGRRPGACCMRNAIPLVTRLADDVS